MRYFSVVCFLLLLFETILLVSPLMAQPTDTAQADSLLRVLQGSKPDTSRVNILLKLGAFHVYKSRELKVDLDSARTYTQQAQSLSKSLAYYQGEVESLNLLGTISREAKEFPKSITYHKAAINRYKRHQDIEGMISSYLLLSLAHRDQGDARQARKEVQTAIALATKYGHLNQAGEAYLVLGNTYAIDGEEFTQRIKFYKQALPFFTQSGNKKRQADVHKDIGDFFAAQNRSAQALIELRKALALYQSIGNRDLQGIYDLLGAVYSQLGDYEEGLRYGLLAVRTAENLKDSSLQLCTIYNRVGLTYMNSKQLQEAYSYFNKSLLIAQKYNDYSSIIILTYNIGIVLLKLNQPDKVLKHLSRTVHKYSPQNIRDSISITILFLGSYNRLKQYTTAQLYCNQLISISGKLAKYDSQQQRIYANIIPFFLASKQYSQARYYLTKRDYLCKETNNLAGASGNHLHWFKLDSLQGNYLSAIAHFQQYNRLQDSLLNQTKTKQIASLEVLHETQQKEQNIKLKQQQINLLTKEGQIKSQKIQQDQLVRNVIIGGAILLSILLGLIYNRYLLKQRSNRLLQSQQQKLQSQHKELQAQQQELQAHQKEIDHKNSYLSELLTQKDSLLTQKDKLLEEKDTLLIDKEWLLKEIHHRVKNNLQVVMSLLNSQAASLEDEAALSAIQESQNRVQAIALIHQKLYQSESVARIPMADYISEVVAYLHESYNLLQTIQFDLEVEPIELDVSQAVPLGLIINEAITNAFKYAFPQGRSGMVRLSLHRLAATTYELTILDNGVGLPVGYQPASSRSLGMKLLHGFSRQLGGKLNIISPPGLSLSLVFTEEQLQPILTRVANA
jgi:two-component sensor histidine kinase/tetratricopeptide (TPR) repeat protein